MTNWVHVLEREDVEVIYERLSEGDRGAVIARDFGISPQTVSAIKTGKIWGHVTGLREPDPWTKVTRAVLTENDVRDIDAALRAGMTCTHLAKRFGVTYSAIHAIKQGTTWAWITGRPVCEIRRKTK